VKEPPSKGVAFSLLKHIICLKGKLMSSNYAQISATTIIKTQAAKLKGIFVSSASATPTIVVYDAQTATTTVKVIDTFTPVSATNYSFFDGISAEHGLYIVIGGTVSCTVYYE